MPPKNSPRSSARLAPLQPHDVVAFRTPSLLPAGGCLIGVIASTPSSQLDDGTSCAVVQPRPLLFVPAQPIKKVKTVKLTGRTVDRLDPVVSQLRVVPIPATPSSPLGLNEGSNSASHAGVQHAVVTDDEMREMEEQRRSLQGDLEASRRRLAEIDDILRRHQLALEVSTEVAPTTSAAPSHSRRPTTAAAGPTGSKAAEDAGKAVEKAERDLLLARAGLRTVSTIAWSDLQLRTSRTSAPSLVGLVETAVALLHDAQMTAKGFDEAVQQSTTLALRLAAVKSIQVTAEDRTAMLRYLTAVPTGKAVAKEHRTAAALHKWLTALHAASQAQLQLQAATQQDKKEGIKKEEEEEKGAARSPDPAPQDAQRLTPSAEAALRKERVDHVEYAEMAEEEIAALDALMAEAKALAVSSQNATTTARAGEVAAPPPGLDESQTVTPALLVPMPLVVCVFAPTEAPNMTACAATPIGTPVAFALPVRHRLVAALRLPAEETATSTVVAETTEEEREEEGRASGRGSLPATRLSPRRKSGTAASTVPTPGEPAAAAAAAAVVDRKPSTASPRPSQGTAALPSAAAAAASPPPAKANKRNGDEMEEKVRLLEARLSAALQQNTKEAELQLLRDEVTAKRAELQRITEERDRLLAERRERSLWSYGATGKRRGESPAGQPGSQPGSGRYARQSSAPRDMVDRSLLEELEEQLTAAHQRIAELQVEASQVRRGRRRPSLGGGDGVGGDAAGAATDATGQPLRRFDSIERAGGVAADAGETSVLSDVSPVPASRGVAQAVYDELEQRMEAARAELEAQRQSTQRLEEQLNSALHSRAEAEGVVAVQKRELAEVWERLEAAEARAEEQELLTQQQILLAQAQTPSTSPQQQQQQQQQQPLAVHRASPSVASTGNGSFVSAQQVANTSALSGPPRLPNASVASVRETSVGFVIPSLTDAETKSQANDDTVTVTAGAAFGNTSRLTIDPAGRSISGDAFPTFGAGSVSHAELPPRAMAYYRGTTAASATALQSRPVEQLSTIELRHEVHRLREDVERHQSGEMRLTLELQTLREKQKAEQKRRRDARLARKQMLTRMQDSIAEDIERMNRDLEEIPTLLDRVRAEAETLTAKRRMHH